MSKAKISDRVRSTYYINARNIEKKPGIYTFPMVRGDGTLDIERVNPAICRFKYKDKYVYNIAGTGFYDIGGMSLGEYIDHRGFLRALLPRRNRPFVSKYDVVKGLLDVGASATYSGKYSTLRTKNEPVHYWKGRSPIYIHLVAGRGDLGSMVALLEGGADITQTYPFERQKLVAYYRPWEKLLSCGEMMYGYAKDNRLYGEKMAFDLKDRYDKFIMTAMRDFIPNRRLYEKEFLKLYRDPRISHSAYWANKYREDALDFLVSNKDFDLARKWAKVMADSDNSSIANYGVAMKMKLQLLEAE